MPLDRHALYQKAVQSPEIEVDLFDRVFRRARRRAPLSLREDFCGTAFLSTHWVESDDEREAVGVDHDREVLLWGERHNLSRLDDERDRIRLVERDVRELSDRTFDIICASNFSWATFRRDADLLQYLARARACLEDDGAIFLELFGGRDLVKTLTHVHRKDGFTYVWEHKRYEAASAVLTAAIHFELDDGSTLKDAFQYEFKLRTGDEAASLLKEAGFSRTLMLIEQPDGRFARVKAPPDGSSFNGYLVGLV